MATHDPKEQNMNATQGVTLEQINETIKKIVESLKDWQEGRMTSPDDRDHVIAACEVLGVDWHLIDRDTDNDIVGKIANEVYEDSGETITDIPDLATFILTRLFEEGVRPASESDFVKTEELKALGSPALVEIVRQGGPSAVVDAARSELESRGDSSLLEESYYLDAHYRDGVAGYGVVDRSDYSVVRWFEATKYQDAASLRDLLNSGSPVVDAKQTRRFLIQVSVELPADTQPFTAEEIAKDIHSSLEVALDDISPDQYVPALAAASKWSITSSEEV